MELRQVKVSEVVVLGGRRPLRNVAALVESIGAIGLLNPITVKPQPESQVTGRSEGFTLIAGMHRLEACKQLGWETIPAVVLTVEPTVRDIAEIDENIVRNELTALERAEQLLKRKLLYEALYPDAPRHGGDRKSKGNNFRLIDGESAAEDVEETISLTFTEATAQATGLTARSIRYDTAIAEKIADGVKEKIRGTELEDSKTDLIALSRMTPGQQHAAVKAVQEGKAESVKEYAGRTQPRPAERPAGSISIPRDPVAAAAALAKAFSTDDLAKLIAILLKGRDGAT